MLVEETVKMVQEWKMPPQALTLWRRVAFAAKCRIINVDLKLHFRGKTKDSLKLIFQKNAALDHDVGVMTI